MNQLVGDLRPLPDGCISPYMTERPFPRSGKVALKVCLWVLGDSQVPSGGPLYRTGGNRVPARWFGSHG